MMMKVYVPYSNWIKQAYSKAAKSGLKYTIAPKVLTKLKLKNILKYQIQAYEEVISKYPQLNKDIIEIIAQLKNQMTMIVITHHIKFAKIIADRIIFMDHGKVLADQPANTFFKKPSSHRARLFLQNVGDLI